MESTDHSVYSFDTPPSSVGSLHGDEAHYMDDDAHTMTYRGVAARLEFNDDDDSDDDGDDDGGCDHGAGGGSSGSGGTGGSADQLTSEDGGSPSPDPYVAPMCSANPHSHETCKYSRDTGTRRHSESMRSSDTGLVESGSRGGWPAAHHPSVRSSCERVSTHVTLSLSSLGRSSSAASQRPSVVDEEREGVADAFGSYDRTNSTSSEVRDSAERAHGRREESPSLSSLSHSLSRTEQQQQQQQQQPHWYTDSSVEASTLTDAFIRSRWPYRMQSVASTTSASASVHRPPLATVEMFLKELSGPQRQRERRRMSAEAAPTGGAPSPSPQRPGGGGRHHCRQLQQPQQRRAATEESMDDDGYGRAGASRMPQSCDWRRQPLISPSITGSDGDEDGEAEEGSEEAGTPFTEGMGEHQQYNSPGAAVAVDRAEAGGQPHRGRDLPPPAPASAPPPPLARLRKPQPRVNDDKDNDDEYTPVVDIRGPSPLVSTNDLSGGAIRPARGRRNAPRSAPVAMTANARHTHHPHRTHNEPSDEDDYTDDYDCRGKEEGEADISYHPDAEAEVEEEEYVPPTGDGQWNRPAPHSPPECGARIRSPVLVGVLVEPLPDPRRRPSPSPVRQRRPPVAPAALSPRQLDRPRPDRTAAAAPLSQLLPAQARREWAAQRDLSDRIDESYRGAMDNGSSDGGGVAHLGQRVRAHTTTTTTTGVDGSVTASVIPDVLEALASLLRQGHSPATPSDWRSRAEVSLKEQCRNRGHGPHRNNYSDNDGRDHEHYYRSPPPPPQRCPVSRGGARRTEALGGLVDSLVRNKAAAAAVAVTSRPAPLTPQPKRHVHRTQWSGPVGTPRGRQPLQDCTNTHNHGSSSGSFNGGRYALLTSEDCFYHSPGSPPEEERWEGKDGGIRWGDDCFPDDDDDDRAARREATLELDCDTAAAVAPHSRELLLLLMLMAEEEGRGEGGRVPLATCAEAVNRVLEKYGGGGGGGSLGFHTERTTERMCASILRCCGHRVRRRSNRADGFFSFGRGGGRYGDVEYATFVSSVLELSRRVRAERRRVRRIGGPQ